MKKVITERDILELEKKGTKVLVKTKDTIITPLAFRQNSLFKIYYR